MLTAMKSRKASRTGNTMSTRLQMSMSHSALRLGSRYLSFHFCASQFHPIHSACEIALSRVLQLAQTAQLLANQRKSRLQWGARDLNHPPVRIVHLQYQEDRARHRQCGGE